MPPVEVGLNFVSHSSLITGVSMGTKDAGFLAQGTLHPFYHLLKGKAGFRWVSHSPDLWSVIGRTAQLCPGVAGYPKKLNMP